MLIICSSVGFCIFSRPPVSCWAIFPPVLPAGRPALFFVIFFLRCLVLGCFVDVLVIPVLTVSSTSLSTSIFCVDSDDCAFGADFVFNLVFAVRSLASSEELHSGAKVDEGSTHSTCARSSGARCAMEATTASSFSPSNSSQNLSKRFPPQAA